MSDEESESIELGPDADVEGVPIAQVAARLTWGIEASRIRRREGSTTVRTPDGPRTVDDLLDETDRTYFESRQDFRAAIEDVIGSGPVPAESVE
ncbi:DUF5789 family protein [Halococcoides cellulosivorans]|uniref:Uncharacterized protein n=1 Tax=Halococcoides cellulosivorans TaxID=1679096 RepID=A0A2R4X4D3_9EURY|nr:DUF5789 family protein [Halococcoides cellulosivorans]AWB28656.1 hypothetical protein HARCEL1_06000 [Halococcoides cellulosivorans]